MKILLVLLIVVLIVFLFHLFRKSTIESFAAKKVAAKKCSLGSYFDNSTKTCVSNPVVCPSKAISTENGVNCKCKNNRQYFDYEDKTCKICPDNSTSNGSTASFSNSDYIFLNGKIPGCKCKDNTMTFWEGTCQSDYI